MLVRTALTTVIALLVAGIPATAAAETVDVGPVAEVAGMSAWHGHVVFSQRDGQSSPWQLMAATTEGIRALPVPAQPEPLSADVGPDTHGRPAVVYATCVATRTPDAPGCHIHELSLARAGARPHLVRALMRRRYSDTAPSVWRGRIAFGRTLTGVRGTAIAAMFLQRRPGSHELIRLARGSVPRCGQRRCHRRAQPAQSDLGPHGLAVLWTMSGGDAIPQDDEELWRLPLDGRAGTLLDSAVMAECGFGPITFVSFSSPSLSGRRVSYLRHAGDCWPTRSAFVRTGPSPMQQRRHVVGGDHLAYGMARDGDRIWWVRGARVPQRAVTFDPCAANACRLLLSRHVGFSKVRVRRRPAPPIDTSLLG